MKTFSKNLNADLQHKTRRGMTLVEIMFAILIIAVLVIVLPKALEYPRSMVVKAAWKQNAITAANEAMEMVIALGYGNAGKLDINNDVLVRHSMNGMFMTGTITSVQINPVGDDPVYEEVTVSITYPGETDPLVLVTHIYRNVR